MIKQGKVLNIKITKNNVFILLKDSTTSIIQLVLKKHLNIDSINIKKGDVISCNVEQDDFSDARFKTKYESYIIKSLKTISNHVENLKFSVNIDGVKRYSLVKNKTREFLNSLDYVEVTVPTLTDDPVSSKSKNWETEHYYSGKQLYLRKTMDPFLRILSCNGFDKIYSVGDIYRNEHITSMRQPVSEMLSIFTNYGQRDDMIKMCLDIMDSFGYLNNKIVEYSKSNCNNILDKKVIEIITDYPVSVESNAKVNSIENISSEFKIKYLGKTIVHGVEEITDIQEYSNMLLKQGKLESYGDLEILRNCIADGGLPCYNLGISLQRMVMLFEELSLKDINPFPFSRFKIKEKKHD